MGIKGLPLNDRSLKWYPLPVMFASSHNSKEDWKVVRELILQVRPYLLYWKTFKGEETRVDSVVGVQSFQASLWIESMTSMFTQLMCLINLFICKGGVRV